MHTEVFSPRAVRRGLIELIAQVGCTHAITLNSDRAMSKARIKQCFGTFCAEMDREIFGKARVRTIPSGQRFKAFAVPEHLDTNAHLHAHADLSPFIARRLDFERAIYRCWMRSNRAAGSVHVQIIRDDGSASYSLKEARSNDPTYFLSSDFHPL